MWEAHGAEIQVAIYVKAVIAADHRSSSAADRKAAISIMDDLGLSEGGRRRNRWIIDEGPQETVTTRDDPDRASAKARFRSIEGGAAS